MWDWLQWLHFGFVLSGVGQSNKNGFYYIKQLSEAIKSGLSLSRGTPMHVVIIRKTWQKLIYNECFILTLHKSYIYTFSVYWMCLLYIISQCSFSDRESVQSISKELKKTIASIIIERLLLNEKKCESCKFPKVR